MATILQFRRDRSAPASYEEVTLEEAEEELLEREAVRQHAQREAEELLLDVELALSGTHRRVLELYFGVGGGWSCDVVEIAVLLEVTTGRVMRLLGEAIHFASGDQQRETTARKAA